MALFKTIEEVKKYIAVNANTRLNSILPYILEAEEMFILPLLGSEEYDNLNSAYGAESMSPKYANLLPYVQRALINYAYFLYTDDGTMSISDQGFQVNNSQNAEPAPQWKINAFKKRRIEAADRYADKLLEYLELNSVTYIDWAESESFSVLRESFIKNAAEFDEHVSINGSRRVFKKIKPFIRQYEELVIRRLLCSEQYLELKNQIRSGTVTPINQMLIDRIKPLIANNALYKAIPQMRLQITDEGLYVTSASDGFIKSDAAQSALIKELRKDLLENANQYESSMISFLDENLEDYPLYRDRTCHETKVSNVAYRLDNDPQSSFFGV